jgi:hypothetical protein
VRATHDRNQIGIIRLMFPSSPYDDHHDLVPISWDEFFDQFQDRGLAFVFEDDSRFNKLVSRDSLEDRDHGHRGGHRAMDRDGDRGRGQDDYRHRR